MADIDFDELDKAVNSLMSRHNSEETKVQSSEQTTDRAVDASSSRDIVAAPADRAPAVTRNLVDSELGAGASDYSGDTAAEETMTELETGELSAQTPKAPVPSLVTKRHTGRFMDVVHPSSDMTTASTRQELSPNRTGARKSQALQPLTTTNIDETDSLNHQAAAPVDEAVSQDDSVNKPESTEPMESPFLTNVSVDKRPLGAFAQFEDGTMSLEDLDAAEQSAEGLVISDDPVEADELELSPKGDFSDDKWSTEPEQDTITNSMEDSIVEPPELSAEVLALDSMEVSGGEVIVYEEPEPKLVVDSEPETESSDFPTTPDLIADSDNKITSSDNLDLQRPIGGLMSTGDISQQYKADGTDSPEPSAVFEAASESPQPLTHPDKKKSGWMVLVWIVILLLIGVAGGVLVWYFLVR